MSYDLVGTFPALEETGTHVYADIASVFPPMTGVNYTGATIDVDLFPITGGIEAKVGAVVSMQASFPAVVSNDIFTGATLRGSFGAISGIISATVEIIVNVDADLPVMTGEVVAFTGILAGLEGTLGALSGQVHSFEAIRADMLGSFGAISGAISASKATICNLEGVFGALSGQISAITGISVSIDVDFPGISEEIFYAAKIYQTYCLKLFNKELVSKFTNYDFDSYGVINGTPLAAGRTGLFRIGGIQDAGLPIASTIKTPDITFGTYLMKKLRAFKFGGKLNGQMLITVSNGVDFWTTTIEAAGSIPAFQKGYFTHAARGEMLNFTVQNVDGADFIINEMSLYLMVLER